MIPRKPPAPRSSVRDSANLHADIAQNVRSEDILVLRTGRVRVVEAHSSRGGVELLVVPADRRKPDQEQSGGSGSRILWFWPSQGVQRTNDRSAPSDSLKARLARPLSGAAAKKAAQ